MIEENNKLIAECPHCGDNTGFYRKGTVSGTYVCHYDFNGENGNNTHMHDGVRYNEHQTCFCTNCHAKLKIKHPKS